AASRKLQVLYKSLVGEARSGLTQLVELGESAENYGVSAGAIEASERKHTPLPVAPIEVPARGSATLTGVPQRQTPMQPMPEPEDEVEPTVELPMEDALQPNPPRATLPMMLSRPQSPPRGQPRPGSTPSSPVLQGSSTAATAA